MALQITNFADMLPGVNGTLNLGSLSYRFASIYANTINAPNVSTQQLTFTISNPAVGGIPGPKIPVTWTATKINSYTTAATSVTFNIEDRATIGSAGTDMLAADQVAVITGVEATSFASGTLTAGHWLWIDISAVSGTPTKVVITLTYTI